jgi:hypothetical protein
MAQCRHDEGVRPRLATTFAQAAEQVRARAQGWACLSRM